jgi:hypothetical protein
MTDLYICPYFIEQARQRPEQAGHHFRHLGSGTSMQQAISITAQIMM